MAHRRKEIPADVQQEAREMAAAGSTVAQVQEWLKHAHGLNMSRAWVQRHITGVYTVAGEAAADDLDAIPVPDGDDAQLQALQAQAYRLAQGAYRERRIGDFSRAAGTVAAVVSARRKLQESEAGAGDDAPPPPAVRSLAELDALAASADARLVQ